MMASLKIINWKRTATIIVTIIGPGLKQKNSRLFIGEIHYDGMV